MKPVLVDTSVWRSYFRGAAKVQGLGSLLEEDDAVLVHPFILGELVLGGLSAQEEALFDHLPRVDLVPHAEVLALVRQRRLMRRGIGWIDAHLLASVLVSSALLWTVDTNLAEVAAELKVGFRT